MLSGRKEVIVTYLLLKNFVFVVLLLLLIAIVVLKLFYSRAPIAG